MKKAMTSAEKKQNMKMKKEKAAFNKKVLGMNFENLKKTFLESMDSMGKVICETVTWNAEQRDEVIKFFGKEIKKINDALDIGEKNFQTLDKRLHAIEGFTAILAIKTKESLLHKHLTYKERQEIANMVSIKWDKNDDKIMNKAA